MNRHQRAVILLHLIDTLRRKGSWCGETHIQKAAYFLAEQCGVPLEGDFIIYKHGPFSFELRDELTAFRADGLLSIEPQPPYGPRFKVTSSGESLKERFPKTLGNYRKCVEAVADVVGKRGVSDLERLATALYVTRKKPELSCAGNRAQELHRLKPHVSLEAAKQAIEELDAIFGPIAGCRTGRCSSADA